MKGGAELKAQKIAKLKADSLIVYVYCSVLARVLLYGLMVTCVCVCVLVLLQRVQTMTLLRFSAIPAAVKNYGCGGLAVSVR